MAPEIPSEDIVGQKWDRCLANTTIKLGTGALVGSIFSLIFFKRKSWPVIFGTGVGLGIGYANCQHSFYSRSAPYIFNPPWWQMNPEMSEKWKKNWEEKWKAFKPKEVVMEKDKES